MRWLIVVAALLLSYPALAQDDGTGAEKPVLGVFTTLPLAWGEAGDLGAIIRGESKQHWLRAVLDEQFRFLPLDHIDDSEAELTEFDYMLLAQPRALGADENVALDAWVRDGGRLLLFADPMMTGESQFGIGDRRRPQDVALLSPILARWGLEMTQDAAQETADGKMLGETMIPVSLYGTLSQRSPAGGGDSSCEVLADGVVAECRVGEGHVLILADAAMLDPGMGDFSGVRDALDTLITRAFRNDS